MLPEFLRLPFLKGVPRKLQGFNRHALQIVIFKYDTHVSVEGKEGKVKTTLDTMVPSSMKTTGFLTRPAETIDSKEKQEQLPTDLLADPLCDRAVS